MTEKLDESSVLSPTIPNVNNIGECCGNLKFLEDVEHIFWKVASDFQEEANIRQFGKQAALHGDLPAVGQGIQCNKLKLNGQTLRLFDDLEVDKRVFEL